LAVSEIFKQKEDKTIAAFPMDIKKWQGALADFVNPHVITFQ